MVAQKPELWLPVDLTGAGLFVSDFHAGRDAAADAEALTMFAILLKDERMRPEWICFGGDTFDFLVGPNKVALQRYEAWIETMSRIVNQGIRVYVLEGNHDFHLDFLANLVPGLNVVPDVAYDPSRNIILSHGDREVAGPLYKVVRKLFRHPITPTTLQIAPDRIVDLGAVSWSTSSHKIRGGAPDDAYLYYTVKSFSNALESAPVDLGGEVLWLAGHIHWPMHCNLLSEVQHESCFAQAHLAVNGYWPSHRSVIAVHPTAPRGQFLEWTGSTLQKWPESKPQFVHT